MDIPCLDLIRHKCCERAESDVNITNDLKQLANLCNIVLFIGADI